ncbi:MAG: NAD+ synthase [Halanaerobium sp. 4-GBenrich]|jgi:NAD+ synthase|uniref:NH(3)-dependent NAD(+) synthetase n=1 Tax=Halanaerobium congolense TaxID=54121 RepID=A0A1M7MDR3_9FIRM|nr:NAD(+) synthase [Halanaerobium congolense]ODS50820.1 MAG: NAD+ synthase [Halanaerobium sp. 4-GBenrich]PUU93171.1 MAG: NAD+ synthase [Halanaerobium sp.]PXV67599.1 NAD+ synthase [Halanaerobium congolense]TDP26668.1 NAD+ synthase [Halanaerobium congolense]SDI55445.1 NAD+ synthase [Halanaerobium congolense]
MLDRNYKKIESNLINWIREKVHDAGCQGAVIGLSGGIDSSVTSLLCQKAFPENTLGIIMPCFSNPEDKVDAVKHAEKFSIKYKEIDLSAPYQKLLQTINKYDSEAVLEEVINNKNLAAAQGSLKLALANMKPRLRMTLLYYYANLNNYLVVGTDNRSELKLGYFTKYGDGGIDIAPLGNLVKLEVRGLARKMGIDQKIITKKPSAGLWNGQSDQDEIGLSYREIDYYIVDGKADVKTSDKIEKIAAANQHKLELPAVPDF